MKKIFKLLFVLSVLCIAQPYIAQNHLQAQVILTEGHIENCIAGESMVAPVWVYISSSDGKMYKANATSTSNPAVGLVFASVTSGNTGQIAFSGYFEWPSATFTPGQAQYLSAATSGAMTTTAPANVQKLGYSVTSGRFKIDPQPFVSSGGGGGGGVATITGPGVDNTDAANPVVNARPYKVYTALLSQSGTSDPTATVLENTLGGTVVWTRDGAGQYRATLTGAFVAHKTLVLSNVPRNSNADVLQFLYYSMINSSAPDYVAIYVKSIGDEFVDLDNVDERTSIEIRVYP